MNKDHKTIVLLDTHAIIHRAYHALPDFASSSGEPTGALYGLCTMLLKLIEDLKPDFVIACFDLPQKTHRHEVYKEYKGTRKEIEEPLVHQLKRSRDVFEAFNIPLYAVAGYEADDLLGTIAELLKADPHNRVIIASGDMDTLQLVDEAKVQVFTLRKGIKDTVMYDEDAVKERFLFAPALLPDFKGLRGDPSDNIIGIKGIGEKTATTLVSTFGTLEHMYDVLEKDEAKFTAVGITPRIIELLRTGKDEALFSKTLATIRRDAPVAFALPEQHWKESVDLEKLGTLFATLEFRTMLAKVKEVLGGKPKLEKRDIQGDLKKEGGAPRVAREQSESTQPKEEKTPADKELCLALSVLNSEYADPSVEDVLSYANTTSKERATEYIFSELKKQDVLKVYEGIEKPLMPVIETMEQRGISVDVAYLAKLSKEYHTRIEELEQKIWQAAGESFNVASPKQLGVILFERLGLKAKNQKKTASGSFSTKESELEKLKGMHPIIEDVLEFRMLSKLTSTYIDSLPHLVGKDGRVHTTYSQIGAATGRMSSNNPNLQNIPIKSEEGKKIRNAFIAAKGLKLVACDYSQIELRIAAFLSGDEKLIEIFSSGGDIHTGVAAQVFGVDAANVDAEMRRKAKVINFGILYGMGVNALRGNLNSTKEEAQFFYDEYFKTFSTLATYLQSTKDFAKQNGYTETFFGRRRYFPQIRSRLPFMVAESERMAINAPIQGTSADIIKRAMIDIHAFLSEKHTGQAFMLLQVHDELVFEMDQTAIDTLLPRILSIMENVLTAEQMKGVPLKVNAKIGTNWGDMK